MRKYPEPKLFHPKNPNKYVGDANNIICRSGIEQRYFKYFDESPSILKYSSEEISIKYINPFDKKIHRYFPDFLIQVKTKTGEVKNILIEIKHSSDLMVPKKGKKKTKTFLTENITYEINQAKWRAAEIFCKKNNMDFWVLTEQHIKLKWQ